jgi:hypothetical protein
MLALAMGTSAPARVAHGTARGRRSFVPHPGLFVLLAALAAPIPALAAPCCLDQTCEDLEPAVCRSLAGLPGYCEIGEVCGAPSCDEGLIQPVGGVSVERLPGTPDLRLSWTPDPNANAYSLRYVLLKDQVPSLRGDNAGVSIPGRDPSTVPGFLHPGAVTGNPGEVHYYHALGRCLVEEGKGACCEVTGFCTDGVEEATCSARGGCWQGEGSQCSGARCPAWEGACCLSDHTCVEVYYEVECDRMGGWYAGWGSQCGDCSCGNAFAGCRGEGNVLHLDGDPGEYIHPGTDTITEGTFTPDVTPAVDPHTVTIRVVPADPGQGSEWNVCFSSRELGDRLRSKQYEDAELLSSASPDHPGLSVTGDERSCSTVSGSFWVHHIVVCNDVLQQLSVSWVQQCDGETPALRGCLRYER